MSFFVFTISIFIIGSIYFFLKDYLHIFSKASEISNAESTPASSVPVVEEKTSKTKKTKKEKSPVKFLKEVETVGKKSAKKVSTEKEIIVKKRGRKPASALPKSTDGDTKPSKRGNKKK